MTAHSRRRALTQEPAANSMVATTETIVSASTDIPGLTREQMLLLHNWLSDSYGLHRERLTYVALVMTPAGNWRRRVYLTLAAAHAAVERAEARGVDARVQLCALVPVQAEG